MKNKFGADKYGIAMSQSIQRANRFPIAMLCYLIFAVAATTFSIVATFNESLGAATVPYTGWIFGVEYAITIVFAVLSCVFSDHRIARAVISYLKLFIIFGTIDLGLVLLELIMGVPNFDNPYLTYSPWRPLITIGLPAMWWFILSRQYAGTIQQEQVTSQPMHESGEPDVVQMEDLSSPPGYD